MYIFGVCRSLAKNGVEWYVYLLSLAKYFHVACQLRIEEILT